MRSNRIVVTVVGRDKVGIIAAVANVLAEANINIVDISQTILRDFFTMIMIADMEKSKLTFAEIAERLDLLGNRIGVKIKAQHEEVFDFMHRI